MHIGIRYACTFLFPLESQQNYFDYKVMADIKKNILAQTFMIEHRKKSCSVG